MKTNTEAALIQWCGTVLTGLLVGVLVSAPELDRQQVVALTILMLASLAMAFIGWVTREDGGGPL